MKVDQITFTQSALGGAIERSSVAISEQQIQDRIYAVLFPNLVKQLTVLCSEFGTGNVMSHIEKIITGKEKGSQFMEEHIKQILFANTLNEVNPIVIYENHKPIFWNLAMEKITGYTFSEIQEMDRQGVDIMDLLYGHSDHELNRVRDSIGTVLETGIGYEERIFTLQNRQGQTVQIAWHNEALPGNVSIRKGSIDLARKIKMMVDSGATIEDLMFELMLKQDEYTSGHINRVMYISLWLAELYGYNEKELGQLKIMAGLHDIGKTQVDDSILKKPGALTSEERRNINNHAGNGVYKGIEHNYGENIRGMPHHCYFYSKWGDPKLTFNGLVRCIERKMQDAQNLISQGITKLTLEEMIENMKQEEDSAPVLFNNLVGKHIPEEARIISIADTIDAIVSRRTYHMTRLILPIEALIDDLEAELLRSTGLISENGKISLDDSKWRFAETTEKKLPHCIIWENNLYIPRTEDETIKIQFDPTVLVKMYQNGRLAQNIKDGIRKNDNMLMPKKIIEIEQIISDLELKKMDDPELFTREDSERFESFQKAKKILEGFLL